MDMEINSVVKFGALLQEDGQQHLTATLSGDDTIFGGVVTGPLYTSVVFVSHRIKSFMKESAIVFCDVTLDINFESFTAVFLQILTVSGNTALPLVQILMENNSEESFIAAFQYLKDLVPRFQPECVIIGTDCIAIKNAWHSVFPVVKVEWSYWHYCFGILKKAEELLSREDAVYCGRIKTLMKMLCCVPLLPQHSKQVAFASITEAAKKLDIDSWVRGRRETTLLLTYQTNNAVGVCRKVLSAKILQPGLWHFLHALRRYEKCAYSAMIALRNGYKPSRKLKVFDINSYIYS